jgi:hypothetical protein
MNRTLAAAAAVGCALLTAAPAAAAPMTLCVYDPSGAGGDAYQNAKEYQAAALAWGVTFEPKPYTSESVAAADFRNGQCDAVILTGVRAQQFNRKSYSIEAIGLLPDYATTETALKVLAKEGAASLMVSGDYETVGIFPAGAVYLYVRDRTLTDISDLAGKKICTLDFDDSAKFMVQHIGGQLEPSDVGTFASKFNNGSCDVAYAPATAYDPLELYKGLGETGGIVRFPLSQFTLQILVRSSAVPAGFGQQSRTWAASRFGQVLELSKRAESGVKADYWVDLDPAKTTAYREMLSDVRQTLVGSGTYDATVVKLVEQIAGSR